MTLENPCQAIDRLDEIHTCWDAVSDLLCPCGARRCDLHMVSREGLSTLTRLLAEEEARALTALKEVHRD